MSGTATTAAVKTAGRKCSALHCVCASVKKFAACFENKASKKVAAIPQPLRANIDAATEKGEDAAALMSKQYFSSQKKLLWYRSARFAQETRHVVTGEYFKGYGLGKFLDDLRFLTQSFFLFLMFVIIGRRSVFPPVKPDSPFVEALKDKVNPNY